LRTKKSQKALDYLSKPLPMTQEEINKKEKVDAMKEQAQIKAFFKNMGKKE